MERFLLAAAVVVLAVVVTLLLERRRPDAPTQGGDTSSWRAPRQLDRADFANHDVPWLVAVFTSATCQSCADALARAKVLGSDAVAVVEAEYSARGDLHRRYRIDAVPTIVVADADGVVRKSFVGPPSATDLWAAVAGARTEQEQEEQEQDERRS